MDPPAQSKQPPIEPAAAAAAEMVTAGIAKADVMKESLPPDEVVRPGQVPAPELKR